VALIKSGGFVEIRVEDNGVGIREADLAKKSSYGLFSIKERLGHIGGILILHSGQDSPTVFTIRIPSNRTPYPG